MVQKYDEINIIVYKQHKKAQKPVKKSMQIGQHDSFIYGSTTLTVCPNCGHRFPPNKIDLHQAYCIRNYKKCQLCGLMIDKHNYQQHIKQLHESRECEYCGEKYTGRELELHYEKCYAKPELCEFCSKPCPRAQLENHKKTCGTRKKECNICKKPIPLKQYQGHIIRCENRKKQKEERSRRQISEQSRSLRNNNQPSQRDLVRQNSENKLQIQPISAKQQLNQKQIKQNKVKPRNFIGREQLKPQIDIIPISVLLAIKIKAQQAQQHWGQKGHQNGKHK